MDLLLLLVMCLRIKDRTSPTLGDILRKANDGKYYGTRLSQAQIVICELAVRMCTLAISLYETTTPKRMTQLVALREELWGWFAEDFDEWEYLDEDTIDALSIWLAKTIDTLQEEHKEIETKLAANQRAGRIAHERPAFSEQIGEKGKTLSGEKRPFARTCRSLIDLKLNPSLLVSDGTMSRSSWGRICH
jgi:hypothetical protein